MAYSLDPNCGFGSSHADQPGSNVPFLLRRILRIHQYLCWNSVDFRNGEWRTEQNVDGLRIYGTK